MDEEFDIDGAVDSIGADLFDKEPELADETEEVINDELQEVEEVAEEEEQPVIEAKAPPASWAKDKHEQWSKIPPEAQDYIELREKQMLDGIEQYKQGHAFAHEVAKTIEPYRDMLQAHGVNEVEAISNLMQWNKTLQSGSLEQRQQAFIALGNNLGLIPQEGQPPIDPRTQELQQRLDRIEREEQARKQAEYQQGYQKVAAEVEAFATDPKNEHFEEVADDVIMLLKTGLDLQQAYDKAVWANPITRAKEQAKLVEAETKARLEKQKEEAKAAKKASSTNVRPLKNKVVSSEPVGSWEDTMREALNNMRVN